MAEAKTEKQQKEEAEFVKVLLNGISALATAMERPALRRKSRDAAEAKRRSEPNRAVLKKLVESCMQDCPYVNINFWHIKPDKKNELPRRYEYHEDIEGCVKILTDGLSGPYTHARIRGQGRTGAWIEIDFREDGWWYTHENDCKSESVVYETLSD